MESRRGHKGRSIKEYAKQHPNLSNYQIADDLGVSVSHVYANLEGREPAPRRTLENKVTKFIKNNPTLSIADIAKELDISYNTVKKYKLKLDGELNK